MTKPCVVVVDPISTGAHVLSHLLNNHPEIVVITIFSPDLSPAAKALTVPGLNTASHYAIDAAQLTPEQCVGQIKTLCHDKALSLATIMPLSEPGVYYSDALNQLVPELRHNANDPAWGRERRNKYFQLERVREAGLTVTGQKLVSSYEELTAWMAANPSPSGFFVTKPVDGAGSESVFKIATNDTAKLKQCWDVTVGHKNKMGRVNDTLLVQHFLEGDEYVIDIVSHHKQHKLVAVWQYSKVSLEQGDFVYLGMKMINPHDPENQHVVKMFEYVKSALDALGVENHATHTELIYDPKEGTMKLLETGARPHGGGNTFEPLQIEYVGYSLVQCCTAALVAMCQPDAADVIFNNKYPEIYPVDDTKACAQIDLINYNRDGVLVEYNTAAVAAIKALPSFRAFGAMPEVGQALPQTKCCFTIAGSICLCGEKEQLQRDITEARRYEKELFIVDIPSN